MVARSRLWEPESLMCRVCMRSSQPMCWPSSGPSGPGATAGQRFYPATASPTARLSALPGYGHLDYNLAAVMCAPLDRAGLRRLR